MKTDKQRTKEFLDSLGIPYKEDETSIIFGDPRYPDDIPECEKVIGYTGFFTKFEFDDLGNFLTVGVWE